MCSFIPPPLSLTHVFSPGIIHGAHQFLPTSSDLIRTYSAIYYPQILRSKDRGVTFSLVCIACRYLVVFHNVNSHGKVLAGALSVIYAIVMINVLTATITQHYT